MKTQLQITKSFCLLILVFFLNGCAFVSSFDVVNSGTVIAKPSAVDLIAPGTAISTNLTPTIRVQGVLTGDTVKVYSDNSCTSEIGSGTSAAASIDITTTPLSIGSYQIHAKVIRAGTSSNCTTVAASYTVIAPAACTSYMGSVVGSVTNSVSEEGQSVAVSGNYAYLGTTGVTNVGIQIVDISNPAAPSNVSYITTQSGAGQIDATSNDILDIAYDSDMIYASTYAGGLLIVDVSNKASPVIKSTINFNGETWGIAKSGNYVYIGSLTDGLKVVDVSNPLSPTVVNTIAGMPLRHIQIVNDRIYGSGSGRIQVISIATPTAPVLLGELIVANHTAYETYYSNNHLYALDKGGRNLLTYSVSNPAAITLVNTIAGGTNDLRSIIGVDDKIFISTGVDLAGEVRAYSIANPAAPSFLGANIMTHQAREIAYADGKVFTANRDGKLEITQVCSP